MPEASRSSASKMRTPGRRAAQAAGDHLAGDRHGLALAQRRDPPAGGCDLRSGAGNGRADLPRRYSARRARSRRALRGADSLQELQRRLQEVGGGWHRPGRPTLHHQRLTDRRADPRGCGQAGRKGASKFRPSRLALALRVVGDQLLEHRLGHGHAANRRAVEREPRQRRFSVRSSPDASTGTRPRRIVHGLNVPRSLELRICRGPPWRAP